MARLCFAFEIGSGLAEEQWPRHHNSWPAMRACVLDRVGVEGVLRRSVAASVMMPLNSGRSLELENR